LGPGTAARKMEGAAMRPALVARKDRRLIWGCGRAIFIEKPLSVCRRTKHGIMTLKLKQQLDLSALKGCAARLHRRLIESGRD